MNDSVPSASVNNVDETAIGEMFFPDQRRRRRSSRRGGNPFRLSQQRKNRGRKSRGRRPDRLAVERFMVYTCVALLAGGMFFAGFAKGKGASQKPPQAPQSLVRQEILPTKESGELLDQGFMALGEGNHREALRSFQKAQDRQSALPGIDYLLAVASKGCGERALAEQAASRAVSKNEMADEARVLLAQLSLDGGAAGNGTHKIVDSMASAEVEFRKFSAQHPADAAIYCTWGDLLRSHGSYRSAAEILQKGIIRADPSGDRAFLSAKMMLAKLQNDPVKSAPSLSGITAMTGEQALGAALAAMQNKQPSDAVLFLERAREFYSPMIFRELMRDPAFDEYATVPGMQEFLRKIRAQSSTAGA
jgi:tetratricopeptide (TPR) repeat protein